MKIDIAGTIRRFVEGVGRFYYVDKYFEKQANNFGKIHKAHSLKKTFPHYNLLNIN
jgi:hypothetical protein